MPDQKLPDPYDGQPIIKTTVKITRAGDGLSEALATDQQTLHMGERVTVVLETEVVGVNMKPLDKETPEGPLVAQYVLAATDRATIADGSEVDRLLDAQAERNEQARGIQRLPMDDDVPRDAAGFPLDKVDALTDMDRNPADSHEQSLAGDTDDDWPDDDGTWTDGDGAAARLAQPAESNADEDDELLTDDEGYLVTADDPDRVFEDGNTGGPDPDRISPTSGADEDDELLTDDDFAESSA